MMAPISNDLRERVVGAIEAGESCRSVAARFGVAVSSAVKWSQRYRASGSVAPGKMGGHRKRVLEPHRAFIVERINQTPHLSLHGLKDELAARGVKVSHDTGMALPAARGVTVQKQRCSPLSMPALTSRGDGNAGAPGRRVSIRHGWYSSTKPGSRPTWHRCGAGDYVANACAVLRRTATGAR